MGTGGEFVTASHHHLPVFPGWVRPLSPLTASREESGLNTVPGPVGRVLALPACFSGTVAETMNSSLAEIPSAPGAEEEESGKVWHGGHDHRSAHLHSLVSSALHVLDQICCWSDQPAPGCLGHHHPGRVSGNCCALPPGLPHLLAPHLTVVFPGTTSRMFSWVLHIHISYLNFDFTANM